MWGRVDDIRTTCICNICEEGWMILGHMHLVLISSTLVDDIRTRGREMILGPRACVTFVGEGG